MDTRRVLQAYGVTCDMIKSWGGNVTFTKWGNAVTLLRDGHVNAILGKTTLPSPFHAEAAKARPMRMLALDPSIIQKLIDQYGYLPAVIPKGTYGIVKDDQASIGSTYYFFSNPKLPERIAYEVVKQMDLHAEDIRKLHVSLRKFEAKKMVTVMKVKPHPGAARYFKEKGWIK